MKRLFLIWLAFGLCLAVGAAAMAWLGFTVARLERMRQTSEQEAQLEERVRLALWRMDSALGAIIARESMRPQYVYTAFYPAEQVYTRLYAQLQQGDVLIASPLLTFSSQHIRIHFQVAPDGTLTSPQAPEGNMRDLAETGYVEHEAVNAAFDMLEQLRKSVGVDKLLSARPAPTSIEDEVQLEALAEEAQQVLYNTQEYAARDAQMKQQRAQAPQKVILPKSKAEFALPQHAEVDGAAQAVPAPGWTEGDLSPVWIENELFLLRRATQDGATALQGCWLNWPTMRPWLLESIRGLLPSADLAPLPIRRTPSARADRRLAALPLVLEPGAVPFLPEQGTSPTRLFLAAALLAIAVATTAVASLLWGALTLSERRGAFVSAVTHELRTPLTTFQMYTEMLAEGMVQDEAKRKKYLDTLHAESNRLAHLVENVLAYARLERRRLATRLEVMDARALLDAVAGPLAQRARQSKMDLILDAPESAPKVRVDQGAVERILFNLVDNACKYAAKAEDRRIHLTLAVAGRYVEFRVCDHGPGIEPAQRRHVFEPFTKAKRDAAHATPGVGLGLGLSRRLARAMGGRLELRAAEAAGACLVLRLPTTRERGEAT